MLYMPYFIKKLTNHNKKIALLIFSLALSSLLIISGCYTIDSLKKGMPKAEGLVVAPAEGHALKIVRDIKVAQCNPLEIHCLDKNCSFCELTPFITDGSTMVIIFMKVHHKHVTVSPIAGLVRQTNYVPGGFRNVFLKDAFKENEHNSIVIEGDIRVTVIQIAGLVARTIISAVKSGDTVQRGDRLGHIKFGSAVAILLPPECKVVVQEGDKVDVAKSIIATYCTIPAVSQ